MVSLSKNMGKKYYTYIFTVAIKTIRSKCLTEDHERLHGLIGLEGVLTFFFCFLVNLSLMWLL